jgi:hypothetical protein
VLTRSFPRFLFELLNEEFDPFVRESFPDLLPV